MEIRDDDQSGYGVMEASSGYSGNDDHTHGAMKWEKMEGEKNEGKERKKIYEKKIGVMSKGEGKWEREKKWGTCGRDRVG